jgi:DNA primase
MSNLVSLLDNILGPHEKHANGEYYWHCPFCGHSKKKLAVNVNRYAWHCWVCNVSGRKLISLFRKLDCSKEQIRELRELLNEDISWSREETVQTALSLPPEYQPLWNPSTAIGYKHALTYLMDRGISQEDIVSYQLGYCSEGIYANRIIVPSFDDVGKLNYFVGRLFYENDQILKYKNPPVSKNVIGFDFYINWKEPIILCEGVFDAMSIKRNAIPLLGKTIPSKLLEKIVINKVEKIYVMLDNDALSSIKKLSRQFVQDGRKVFVVKLTDKDPSKLGFEASQQLISSAKELSFSELMKLQVSESYV